MGVYPTGRYVQSPPSFTRSAAWIKPGPATGPGTPPRHPQGGWIPVDNRTSDAPIAPPGRGPSTRAPPRIRSEKPLATHRRIEPSPLVSAWLLRSVAGMRPPRPACRAQGVRRGSTPIHISSTGAGGCGFVGRLRSGLRSDDPVTVAPHAPPTCGNCRRRRLASRS